MSLSRLFAVASLELRSHVKRPMFWVLLGLMLLMSWGLSTGNVTISSGDSSVGGAKAWLNSEFAVARIFAIVAFLFYTFFASVASGMSVIQDEEHRVLEILSSTALKPVEYIWGKFLGVFGAYVLLLTVHMTATGFLFELWPSANFDEIHGPFRLTTYLIPALTFTLPTLLFFSGLSFAVGERTRKAILVMVIPVAFVVIGLFFLISWSPSWLDPQINRLLQIIEPSGYRWLNETWLEVDRGVDFYNRSHIPFDTTFLLNRLWMVLVALASVALSVRHYALSTSGQLPEGFWARRRRRKKPVVAATPIAAAVAAPRLDKLNMRSGKPKFLTSLLEVLRTEVRELRNQPGLYIFVPLILLETIGSATFAVGAFDTPLLNTPGQLAVSSMNTITLLVCLLLLFYTVESLYRERATGFDSIYYATPLRTAALLIGKALANSFVGVVILLATWIACLIVLLIQGSVGIEVWPFIVTWGLLQVPTFIVWTAFVAFVLALFKGRYTTYGVALGALVASGWFQFRGEMTWPWNWWLWGAVRWSDLGTFALNRDQLILNRLQFLALALGFFVLAIKLFGRTDADHGRVLQSFNVKRGWKPVLKVVPFFLIPLIGGAILASQVRNGPGGDSWDKTTKDYWRKNIATWREVETAAIRHVQLDVALEPEERAFETKGSYELFNHLEEPLQQLPFTLNPAAEGVSWTLDDEEAEPNDRAGLWVFDLDEPLQPGDTVKVGFELSGRHPFGATRNGGGAGTFILPTGVVLHAFEPTFLPLPGFLDGYGVDEENSFEPRDFPNNHFKEILAPAIGLPMPFTTDIEVTAPEKYTVNSVGTLAGQSTKDGYTTWTWKSDYPVKLVNIVAGEWEVERRDGTALFYHRDHTYNVEEMSEALASAKRYYSEWFYPYPWQELKVSEFPNMASYAQGFPTNITFSEGIGFLTESNRRSQAAFMVMAHEAAHQWWGNLITPGLGPGGNVLSEGMAHYSTLLLHEEVLGDEARIEFSKRIEEAYNDRRRVDGERPLVKIDGSRAGDGTVTYDKGAWVMWMLHDLMGREAAFAGLQELHQRFIPGPDHPLLEDLVETLREFAPDTEAFDAYVDQWFFDVVLPEYRLSESSVESSGDAKAVRFTVENVGTGTMPVEIAITRGVRFPDEEEEDAEVYQEERVLVTLGAGESRTLEVTTDFEPQQILVDPDAVVLQLLRERAVVDLS
ncbi:MAG: ABC transporter permease [Acidobacteriota bacterium]